MLIPTLVLLFNLKIPCIFKRFLHIPCPSCGLTRSIKAILKFNLIESFNYNILGIPVFLFIIFSVIFLIIDIIRNDDKYIKNVFIFFGKYGLFIILLLIISMIVNIIRGI